MFCFPLLRFLILLIWGLLSGTFIFPLSFSVCLSVCLYLFCFFFFQILLCGAAFFVSVIICWRLFFSWSFLLLVGGVLWFVRSGPDSWGHIYMLLIWNWRWQHETNVCIISHLLYSSGLLILFAEEKNNLVGIFNSAVCLCS